MTERIKTGLLDVHGCEIYVGDHIYVGVISENTAYLVFQDERTGRVWAQDQADPGRGVSPRFTIPRDCVVKKTKEHIDSLVGEWCHDPCWDIEDTSGFEAHREELTAIRKRFEEQWERERLTVDKKSAQKAGLIDKFKKLSGPQSQKLKAAAPLP